MVLTGPSQAQAQIRFQNGQIQISPATRAQIVSRFQALVPATGDRHVIVRFAGPVGQALRSQLDSEGLTLLNYIGDQSYFAVLSSSRANVAQLSAHVWLNSIAAIENPWKMHPDLIAGRLPEWAVVSHGRPVAAESVPEKVEPDVGVVVAVYVKLYADVALETDGVAACRRHGAVIRSKLTSINGLVIELPWSKIPALAAEDSVEWIEPPLPKLSPVNAENRALVGADIAQAPPYNLSGAGVTVLVYDAGSALASHVDFGGRLTVRDESPLYDHSTHVAGTIGGSGAASGGMNRGMAPGVQLESYGFEQVGGLSPGFLYTDPGDLEADYAAAIGAHGANLANNSIGSNVAANSFPCEWEGNYGLTSALIDSIARGSLGASIPIIWAAGNERQPPFRCGAMFNTIAPPAGSKNAICVGAVNSNDESMTPFSSWGPTDDGRIKPDVCAPGCQVGGDNGVTSCSAAGDTAYSVLCGTSMAAPTVTGVAALLLEDYRAKNPGLSDFSNSMLKAVLVHTAVDLGNAGPDYKFGYGSVRVIPAIEFLRGGEFLERTLDQSETFQAVVRIDPGESPLKVTLAWDDVPASLNVVTTLVNDLDLRVYDPSGAAYFPWTLNPAAPAAAAVQTQPDHTNNVEQIVINAPTPGIYRIEVAAFQVPQGPQTFSLCASPRIESCSSKGSVLLNRTRYSCYDAVIVDVSDCNLNADSQTIETTSVHVASTTDPLGQMLQLTETGANSATFTGTLYLTDQPEALHGMGPDVESWLSGLGEVDAEILAAFRLLFAAAQSELHVANGDVLTAGYVDADDGAGHVNVMATDTAVIDCEGPVVTNLQVASVGPRRATITFETDEPAYAELNYGTLCTSLDQTVTPGGIRSLHTMSLTNLTETTTYEYTVWAADETGNISIVPGDGTCLSFTTPVVPRFFTENFEDYDNDLSGHSLLFTPDGSPDFYSACIEPINQLPTDPAGGTVLNMPDDGPPVQVFLNNGATARLYGVPYSTFYVSPNGYLVFGVPDTWFYETLEKHFINPRVSALFDDLDPTMGGSVSWKQFADRVAVTWLNVPEWFGFNSNTFQVELYFDGRIRISLQHLDAWDGIIGLSAGMGLSPDFIEPDLSTTIPCDEIAPMAMDGSASTTMNSTIEVSLVAGDPNNNILAYVISSLPAHGSLRDPLAGLIENVPYELAGGGHSVLYNGYSGFAGADAFQFYATDEFFPSNTANLRLMVGTPQPIYSFPLDSDPGWPRQGGWAFGPPLGIDGDPTSGWTDANVFGFNLAGAYPNGMISTQYLTTLPMDCSLLAGTHLRFQRWLGVQAAVGDHANVDIASASIGWTPSWQHFGSAILDTGWNLIDLDISDVADGQANVRARWGMGPTDAALTSGGWNLDDIEIWGILPGPCNDVLPGDVDLNGVVDGRDVSAFVNAWLNPQGTTTHQRCAADLFVDDAISVEDAELFASKLLKQVESR